MGEIDIKTRLNAFLQFDTNVTTDSLEPYGNGHINDTFLVVGKRKNGETKRYILQRINTNVFKKPQEVMHNIEMVTEFLKTKTEDERRVLSLVRTKSGKAFYQGESGFWRLYDFVEDALCLEAPETADDFYQSAIAFGEFQRQLIDFPVDKLYETIPNFHNTPDRFEKFLAALKKDPLGRAATAQREIEFVKARKAFCNTLFDAQRQGRLPFRVTHNDTKLNNVMLDKKTRTALCVIDLDTIMLGFSVNDFGDSIRFGASTAADDEKDLSKVQMDINLFETYAKGFIKGCGGLLTRDEILLLPEGAKMMTLECGIRFLTDYLEGDTYFKTKYATQNLDRCRTQFKLVADMESKWKQMKTIIENIADFKKQGDKMEAIVNGKIILKDGIVENRALIYSSVIEGIVDEKDIPKDAQVIDAKGGFVSPGLIDLHIHGYLGKDVCDGEAQSIETISKGLLANGVTGYLPTTMTVDIKVIKKALEVCRALKEKSKSWQGSEILGCHAEGPFINESKKGAQNAKHILKPDADFVKEYSDIIKIVTLAPETDENDFSAIRKICQDTDVVVSMGHTDADYATAKAGIAAGVSHVTHLFNAMSPLSHRAPGATTAALDSDVTTELIVDTFHVDKCFYDLVWELKGRKLVFITDCLPAGGLPFGEYTLGGAKIVYNDIVCRLTDGTVAGSVLRLNCGVWNAYKNSHIPLHECVNCASLNAANVIGIAHRKGSLEQGKDADIIITDQSFEIKKTIIRGKIKYEA